MEGPFYTIFFVLTRVGRDFISALGHDVGGDKKVCHISDRLGFESNWEVIKSVVDTRALWALVSPVRWQLEADEARLLTVYVGKTDGKIYGHLYLPMREDDDALPQSFHHFAFIMNRTDGDSVTGYL